MPKVTQVVSGRPPIQAQSLTWESFLFLVFFLFFFFFFALLFRGAPMAYGGSQARGPIGAIAASLHHSHSNAGSEPCLQPTPQLMAMLDP